MVVATYLTGYPYLWPPPNLRVLTPSLGFYASADPAVIDAHLDALEYAGVKLGIAYSWGEGGSDSERIFGMLLDRSVGRSIRWALFYSQESGDNPDSSNIRADLISIRDRFSNHVSYFRIDGKFVVFVNDAVDPGTDKCNLLNRWKTGNDVGAYPVFRSNIVPSCAAPTDDWFRIGQTARTLELPNFSYSILAGNSDKSVPRDVAAYRTAAQQMVNAKVRWRIINSFNRYSEDSQVESSVQWASDSGYGQYLDVLHGVIP
jgi:hypothetical protein